MVHESTQGMTGPLFYMSAKNIILKKSIQKKSFFFQK